MEKINENKIEDQKDTGKNPKGFNVSVNLEGGGDRLKNVLSEVEESLSRNEPIETSEANKLEGVLSGLKYEYPKGRSMALEAISKERGFIHNTFESWGGKDVADRAKISVEICHPTDQKWTDLETDIDPDKFGEYTINPDTSPNFEMAKPVVLDISSLVGQKLSAVGQSLKQLIENKSKQDGKDYYLPGIEYWEWICRHQDLGSLPEGPEFETLKKELTDNWCFFFGSTLRYSSGHWCVPYLDWNGSSWPRCAGWLDNTWDSDYRVVLLER